MPDSNDSDRALGVDSHIISLARTAVAEAAAIAKPYFREGGQTTARVWSKAGGSPVTEADVAVDTFLKLRLMELLPGAAWLSEETVDDPIRLQAELVWIVDPIDGTRAFVSGHKDWSIAVALLDRGEPVAGFVYAPSLGVKYEAVVGQGATRNGKSINVSSQGLLDNARVSGPKPLFDRMARGSTRLGQPSHMTHLERVPSLALRVARVAEGSIDVGLVMNGSRDWDLAAADLILREAGGKVVGLDGEPIRYNRTEPVHAELVVASDPLRSSALTALNATGGKSGDGR